MICTCVCEVPKAIACWVQERSAVGDIGWVTFSRKNKLVINLTGYQFKLSMVLFFEGGYNTERNLCHFWTVQQRWKELLFSRKWRWVNSCEMLLVSTWGRRLRMHADKQWSWIKILTPKWGGRTLTSGLAACSCPLCL